MQEVWKDIKGYEGIYQVSSTGRVKNLRYNRILKLDLHDGYYKIQLYRNGKSTSFRVNRLVAQTFIPNPDNLPVVNHKDENKINNSVDNLEWCTVKYNNNYGTAIERRVLKVSRPIVVTTKEGNIYYISSFNNLVSVIHSKHMTLKDLPTSYKGVNLRLATVYDTKHSKCMLGEDELQQYVKDNFIRLTTEVPIIAIDSSGNEVPFSSAKKASQELGVIATMITACCRGRRKTTGGYKFKYAS